MNSRSSGDRQIGERQNFRRVLRAVMHHADGAGRGKTAPESCGEPSCTLRRRLAGRPYSNCGVGQLVPVISAGEEVHDEAEGEAAG